MTGAMLQPTVSAIVAAYNYGAFLAETVESALAQHYPAEKLEVVIVDDGSTDDTPAVAADLVARHGAERVRYIRQENAGYVAATNRGFAEARGEVWAMLDADDLWAPDKTALQVACLADPDVGMVYCDLELIDAEGALIEPSFMAWTRMPAVRGHGALGVLTSWGNVATGSSVMVRASLGEVVAPIPADMPYVDWWLAARAADVGAIDYVDRPLVGYRQHGGNLTLNATGDAGVRERIKAARGRRCIITHADLGQLTPDQLVGAWQGVERDAAGAVQTAESAFVPLDRPDAAALAAAAELSAQAARLDRRGEHDRALALWVRAAAHDPFDPARRRRILDHAGALHEVLSELAGARAFVTLADAATLCADPSALAAYAAAFSDEDDATLAIAAPGWDAATTGERLGALLAGLGLDDDPRCPDLLALPDPRASADILRGATDAVLGTAADVPALRTAAERTLAATTRR